MGEQPNAALFFINGYLPFREDKCYLGSGIQPKLKFDMSFVHIRYRKQTISTLMKSGKKSVTILR